MIRFRCPKCGVGLDVDDGDAGGVGNCPRCGQRMRVPGVRPVPPPLPSLPPPRGIRVAPLLALVLSLAAIVLVCVAIYRAASGVGSSSDAVADPPAAGGGKAVEVRGYYKKDGTYVPPHARSAPGGRGGRR